MRELSISFNMSYDEKDLGAVNGIIAKALKLKEETQTNGYDVSFNATDETPTPSGIQVSCPVCKSIISPVYSHIGIDLANGEDWSELGDCRDIPNPFDNHVAEGLKEVQPGMFIPEESTNPYKGGPY